MLTIESLVGVLALATVLAPGRAAAASPSAAGRYSIASPMADGPAFTLLDPAWTLPPIEALETEAAAHRSDERTAEMLLTGAGTEVRAARDAGTGSLSYALSADLSAQLHYERARLFDTAPSATLRDEALPTFSNRPDRDVVGLNMAWHLAGSTVGLAYQLESARAGLFGADSGLTRFMPNSQQATHSLSLGLTRAWGAPDPPPVLLDLPLVAANGAAAEPTPTPVERGSAAPQSRREDRRQ